MTKVEIIIQHKETIRGHDRKQISQDSKKYGYVTLLQPICIMLAGENNLTPSEQKILFWVLSKTYGWGTYQSYFDKDIIHREIGLPESSIYKGFTGLERKKVILRSTDKKSTKSQGKFRIQKDFRKWDIDSQIHFDDIELMKEERRLSNGGKTEEDILGEIL